MFIVMINMNDDDCGGDDYDGNNDDDAIRPETETAYTVMMSSSLAAFLLSCSVLAPCAYNIYFVIDCNHHHHHHVHHQHHHQHHHHHHCHHNLMHSRQNLVNQFWREFSFSLRCRENHCSWRQCW